ncbi:hypothetical protein RAA17_15020 [Komagataeibacter rhaeticus]|nr:hypothetical protein [Komagataeibacter rhaeticus]
MWLGQNTNHIPPHPAVVAAMKQSIDAQEFTAYAPPLGFEALRAAIVADMGVAGLRALVTEGGVSALSMICRARCRPEYQHGHHRPDMEVALPVCRTGRRAGAPDPHLQPRA